MSKSKKNRALTFEENLREANELLKNCVGFQITAIMQDGQFCSSGDVYTNFNIGQAISFLTMSIKKMNDINDICMQDCI